MLLVVIASVIPYPLIVVGFEIIEAKVCVWLVLVAIDTLLVPSYYLQIQYAHDRRNDSFRGNDS